MTAQLLVDVRSTFSMRGKFLQVIANIQLTPATAGKRARPSGNGLNIHTLFKQAFDVASFGAIAIAETGVQVFRVGVQVILTINKS